MYGSRPCLGVRTGDSAATLNAPLYTWLNYAEVGTAVRQFGNGLRNLLARHESASPPIAKLANGLGVGSDRRQQWEGGSASASAKQKQMGIHLPVQPVERVERDDAAPAVEQRDAGPARTPTAPPGWRQVRRVLREHQLRVPLLAVVS